MDLKDFGTITIAPLRLCLEAKYFRWLTPSEVVVLLDGQTKTDDAILFSYDKPERNDFFLMLPPF